MTWTFEKENPYFVYDPEGDGFTFFATEADRNKYSEECIAEYLEDGWNENVVCVIGGKVTHRATQVARVNRPDKGEIDASGFDSEGNYWASEFDYVCRYGLLPV